MLEDMEFIELHVPERRPWDSHTTCSFRKICFKTFPTLFASLHQVEEGDLEAAISILKEGINEFSPRFPDR